MQVFQPGQLAGDGFQGIIAGIDEGRAQEQVFGGVTANRQLGREHEPNPAGMRLAGTVDDFAGIARHVAHHKIELGNANLESHTGARR